MNDDWMNNKWLYKLLKLIGVHSREGVQNMDYIINKKMFGGP